MNLSLHMPCSLGEIIPCSNTLCKTIIVAGMHDTAKRLLEIGTDRGAKDFTEIAKRLGGSDQSATNWKSRGVPNRIIIEAAKLFGANTAYIQNGIQPKFFNVPADALGRSEIIQPKTQPAQPTHHTLNAEPGTYTYEGALALLVATLVREGHPADIKAAPMDLERALDKALRPNARIQIELPTPHTTPKKRRSNQSR